MWRNSSPNRYRHVLEAEAPIDPEELGHTSTWKAFVADQTTLGICINTSTFLHARIVRSSLTAGEHSALGTPCNHYDVYTRSD